MKNKKNNLGYELKRNNEIISDILNILKQQQLQIEFLLDKIKIKTQDMDHIEFSE